MPPQQGPNTGQTVAPTGRGGGAGSSVPSTHKLIRVNGEAYEVPVETTDEEIKAVLGSAPDLHEGATARRPGSSGSVMMDLITDLPSMMVGGGVAKKLAEKPAYTAGNWLMRKAVPGMSRYEAGSALRAGAAPLLKSSVRKLADNPLAKRAIQGAMPTRMGGPLTATEIGLGLGGAADVGGMGGLSTALAAGRVLARPLPLSIIAQGTKSLAPSAAGGVGGLATAALMRLLGGGQ